jgi:hypothetical protein
VVAAGEERLRRAKKYKKNEGIIIRRSLRRWNILWHS